MTKLFCDNCEAPAHAGSVLPPVPFGSGMLTGAWFRWPPGHQNERSKLHLCRACKIAGLRALNAAIAAALDRLADAPNNNEKGEG